MSADDEIDPSVGGSLREFTVPETGNLYAFIEKQNVHGLNLTVPEHARAIIKPWDKREDTNEHAESEVDDQMVVHVPFNQAVRLRSMMVKLGTGETRPRHLRVYMNNPNIVDFSDADATKPNFSMTLPDDSGVVEIPLRAAVFASVNALSIHFSESTGGEVSRIFYLGFKGETRAMTKEASSGLTVGAQNAADASLIDRLAEKAKGQQGTAR